MASLVIARGIVDRMAMCKCATLCLTTEIEIFGAIRWWDSRINEGRRNSFGGQGRPDDSTDPQLNASAQDFVPFGTLRLHDSQLPNVTHDGSRTGALNA